ncbi:MAG: hypothetical protein QGG36_17565 [Pirellulaceae bacterium]|jgi:hypothetical protein|nr:hypothetical protein [Pirellulaceae bacterium]MDP7017616.1 hypothetical protein [Pirellulaceae bacterium]
MSANQEVKALRLLVLTGVVWSALTAGSSAQNVTGYGSMADPLLFLLREPAVHDDLQLTADQRARLIELNESFDGLLLASRNMAATESQAQVNKVMTATREQVGRVLSSAQLDRLQQIKHRLRGISCVLQPTATETLRLSAKQESEIEEIVKATQESLKEHRSSTFQGQAAHLKAQAAIKEAKQAEQKQILALLDNRQKERLYAMVGRSFDSSKLGRVSFKAPDFAKGDRWLNSQALQLSDLRGKVVALHFYAFG